MTISNEPQNAPRLPLGLVITPPVASSLVVLTGVLVLVGWSFDLEPLKRLFPGFVAMNPVTAILFIVSGAALAVWSMDPERLGSPNWVKILSAIVFFVAAAKLVGIIGHWDANVDQLFFASKLGDEQDNLPNRMAPNTALNFLLISLSFLTLNFPSKSSSVSQAFAILVGFGALLPITGYLYGVQSFRGNPAFIPMALHTALAFLVLAWGVFFASETAPLTQVFASDGPSGVMARRLFPGAIMLTLILGWLRVCGEQSELYDSEFGTALFATALSILFVILIRWTVGTVAKLEAERALANARLQELNRRKDEMIAVVSHDLCSPLTGFKIVIDVLREKRDEPPDELLDLMDHSVRRMVSMVRGLLDVAKLQSLEIELERENVLVSDVIEQSLEPLKINANAKRITLRFDRPAEEPMLYADRLRLSQVFNNILSNAVKFTPAGGSVVVTVEPAREGVRVAVKDSGLGISKTELPHIFEKYYQTSTKATAGESGAGLGLAIAHELILLHDGEIDVSSEVNRGTSFTVYLPAKPQSKAVRHKTAGATSLSSTGERHRMKEATAVS